MVSGQRADYAEVCEGVTNQDLQRDELDYRRAKDKGDKSLELYKFYVNVLTAPWRRPCPRRAGRSRHDAPKRTAAPKFCFALLDRPVCRNRSCTAIQ